jgi:hypothetical protein
MKKTIDAVAMTRRIRDAHHERLKDATDEERIRFYREEAAQLHELIAREPARKGGSELS